MRVSTDGIQKNKKIVAVIGAGFGGLNVAKSLARYEDVFVLLFDQRNHHLFQPLLYQVATAGLNPADIAVPIRAQFTHQENVRVHLYAIDKVHLVERFIQVKDQDLEFEFDYLVLACGARDSYFGHDDWEKYAPGLKTLEQATEIRRRILLAFENAENCTNMEEQQALLTFIVVGGGATGVELAGAIADISRTVINHDFKKIDPTKAKVILLEAGGRVLYNFSEKISKITKTDLTELGVDVRLNSTVQDINRHGVLVNGEFIKTTNVFWGAGVQSSHMDFDVPVPLDRVGKVIVDHFLSIPHFPHAFVIGDMASFEISPGKTVPGVAPAAIQEGIHVAKIIRSMIDGKEPPPFVYKDKGQMATIGKNRGVLEFGRIKLRGRLAWVAWLVVHIFYLVGFRNRVAVMANWVWSYLFSKRGSRLITEGKNCADYNQGRD